MSEQISTEVWRCRLCAEGWIAGSASFTRHVTAHHPEVLTDGTLLASSTLRLHLDGQDYFRDEYVWKLPDDRVLAHQVVECSREEDDPMRLAGEK